MLPNPLPDSGYILTLLDGTQEYIPSFTKIAASKGNPGKFDITVKGVSGEETTFTGVSYKAIGKTAKENRKVAIVFGVIAFIVIGALVISFNNKSKKPINQVEAHQYSIMTYIKDKAHDPSSYESVDFIFLGRYNDPVLGPESYYYQHSYRAKNGFGALILTKSNFAISANNERIRIVNLP